MDNLFALIDDLGGLFSDVADECRALFRELDEVDKR